MLKKVHKRWKKSEIQKKISERVPQSRRGTLFDGSTGHDNLKPDCLRENTRASFRECNSHSCHAPGTQPQASWVQYKRMWNAQ